MAYNFKSIADVEVVAEPSESANVLIEEDGVIKKAPKTAVGGGGDNNGEYDLDIYIECIDGGESYAHRINTINTFNNIKDKLLNGIKPKSKIIFTSKSWTNDDEYDVEIFDNAFVHYQPEDPSAERSCRITFLAYGSRYSPVIMLNPNGDIYITED